MRQVIGLVFVLWLNACHTVVLPNENSPYYTVPAGARLILHHDLTVPAGRLDVYLQRGLLLTYAEVNPYHPFCTLDLHRRLDTPQTVSPDEFVVTTITQDVRYTLLAPGIALASDGTPGFEIYSTRLALRSDRQPQVSNLTCAQWTYPPLQRHVTIYEIRQVLGDRFTLRLPDASH